MFEAQRTGWAGMYGSERYANELAPAVTHTEDFT